MTAPDEALERPARRWIIPVVVALVTFAAFAPALGADFVSWDDDTNFLRNPMYRGLGWDHLHWMWTTFLLGHYVPLAWMTLGLDHVIWGMDARGYHATNLLLHSVNAVLIYAIACRVIPMAQGSTRAVRGPAAIAALLYSVHPLRVESVAWITERRDVLSSAFFLAAVLAYLRHARSPGLARWYWATVTLFVAALLSKASAVTFPVVLLIMNVYPLRRLRADNWRTSEARPVYLEILPLVALSAATGILSIIALNPGAQLGFADKIAVSAYSIFFYLWKSVLPWGLAPLYEMPAQIAPLSGRFVAGYAVVLGFVGSIAFNWRRKPGIAMGLLAFAVMILPLLGVVQNGVQLAADRYTYQAMQAAAVLSAGALAWWWRRSLAVVGGAAVLVLAALTWRQTTYWKDSETLWKRVLQVDSTSSLAHTALANVLQSEGRLDEAIAHYQASLVINPASLEAENNLGTALLKQGRLDEAAGHFRRTIEISPAHFEAHNNLGTILARQGDAPGAIELFRRAISIKPDLVDAEVNWGNALLRMGRADDAIAHYARGVALEPESFDAEYNWGVALAQQARYEEAARHLRRAVLLKPGDADARNALAAVERRFPRR